MKLTRIVPTLLLLGAGVTPAVEPEKPHEPRSEDGVQAAIHHRNLQFWQADHVQAREQRHDWITKKLDSVGLGLALTYDSLAMGALGDSESHSGASGDATLNLRWQITGDDSRSPLSLNARVRHRHAFTENPPSEMKSATGALWGYVDGFTDAGFQVPEFFFEDRLFDRRLTLRYGQMSIDDLLDGHELRSAKRSFMNQAFSSSPAVGFPGSDLGFVGRWQSHEGWDVTLAISNVAGSNLRETTDWKLDGGALFQALQFGRDFSSSSRLQMLIWRSDELSEADIAAGRGISLTYEQALSDKLRFFLKYAWSDGEASTTQHFATAGLAQDFSRMDRAGVAIASGQASGTAGGWQGVVEIFYRRQVGKSWLITPDLQFAMHDHDVRRNDWFIIGGVRVGLTF